MIETISQALGGASVAMVYALIAMLLIQVPLQVWALVDLAGREQVLYGRKWLWIAVILLASPCALGAITYLVLGRKVPMVADDASAALTSHAGRAVDALYSDGGEIR